MAKPVTHLTKVRQRREVTINGTLCNRVALLDDGMNTTDNKQEVTCKLCRKHPAF
jgi:hypothetical protein